MNAMVLLITDVGNNTTCYIIGAIIALFNLGYLLYSLVKPEKF